MEQVFLTDSQEQNNKYCKRNPCLLLNRMQDLRGIWIFLYTNWINRPQICLCPNLPNMRHNYPNQLLRFLSENPVLQVSIYPVYFYLRIFCYFSSETIRQDLHK